MCAFFLHSFSSLVIGCEKSDWANKKEGTNMSSTRKALEQEHNSTTTPVISSLTHFIPSHLISKCNVCP